MSDNINNTNNNEPTPQTEEKTFTQDDVNRIISERLSKEKSKGETELVKREQEIKQREILLAAKERLTENGFDLELLDALNIKDEETLNKSLEILERHLENKKTNMPRIVAPTPGAPQGDNVRRAMGLN